MTKKKATADAPPCLTWVTPEEARELWRDAPYEDDDLNLYLNVAKGQVLAYGPRRLVESISVDGCVPERYRLAQVMQARNLWNASKMDPNGAIGADGFSFQPFPLDWTVKQVIRPKSAQAVVA